MNREDLLKKLVQKKIRKDAYSLNGGLPNECYCLAKVEQWEVYYRKNCSKNELHIFTTEEEACEYLYNRMIDNSKPKIINSIKKEILKIMDKKMNKEELSRKLVQRKIPKNYYSLDGDPFDECYCLENTEKWEVYYSERGSKVGLRRFVTEEEACEYFYNLIQKNSILFKTGY